MKFQKRKTFYPFPVYEFNLPAGHTCPFAKDCKIKVDEITGKFETIGSGFRRYAASAERFPGVRKSRRDNYRALLDGEKIVIPKDATHIRVHGSGDFFSQEYFDMWLDIAQNNPDIKIWAFTKSVQFRVNRLGKIPPNFTLQASKGGHYDSLIDIYGLKYAQVFTDYEDYVLSGLPLDTNDALAMEGTQSFALLDNFKFKK